MKKLALILGILVAANILYAHGTASSEHRKIIKAHHPHRCHMLAAATIVHVEKHHHDRSCKARKRKANMRVQRAKLRQRMILRRS